MMKEHMANYNNIELRLHPEKWSMKQKGYKFVTNISNFEEKAEYTYEEAAKRCNIDYVLNPNSFDSHNRPLNNGTKAFYTHVDADLVQFFKVLDDVREENGMCRIFPSHII